MYDRPFRWWVQSVMPLVFDDSLSYYEVLAKLTKYIEGLTGDVEQIEKILGTIEGIEDVTQFTEFLEKIQTEIGDLVNLSTQSKSNLVSAINEVALKADIAYWKPPTGIPESDLSQSVQDKLNRTGEATKYIINNKELKAAPNNNSLSELGIGTYTVPTGGIPWDTLSEDVQNRINAGGSGGGTSDYTDLANKPQINGHTLNAGNNTSESLGLGTYSKPSSGIPESDLSAEVQEKLNTSGGIADNQQSFVASRDYEAGELVYINGVLYKTKYKILTGTTMIPGNNIETTDISAELEKINSDIDALQSGAGPDSWNLSATVHSSNSLDIVDFFEYFNCIGGENYNFIVEPVDPSIADGYTLNICKRDGSIAKTENVTSNIDYANMFRFTFTPTDSGEYFCKFHRYTNGTNVSAYKVTIEYTQSQGISELWAQVSKANQLDPRVGAVETLSAQNQTDITSLNNGAYKYRGTLIEDPTTAEVKLGLYAGRKTDDRTGYPDDMGNNYCYIEYLSVQNNGRIFILTEAINGTNAKTWIYIKNSYHLLVYNEDLLTVSDKALLFRGGISENPFTADLKVGVYSGRKTETSEGLPSDLYPNSYFFLIVQYIATNNRVMTLVDSSRGIVWTGVNGKFHRTSQNTFLNDKIWACIGDSLTDPITTRATQKYYDYIVNRTGIQFVNLGVSGTGYANDYNGAGRFIDRVTDIPDNCDVVTIFGSGNDMNVLPIGTANDTESTTVMGWVYQTIQAIFAQKPKVLVGIIAPTPWIQYPPYEDDNKMLVFTTELEKLCKKYSVPFLDLYHESNLRPWETAFRQNFYSRDGGNGVHPDENGNKRFAPMIQKFLEKIVLTPLS